LQSSPDIVRVIVSVSLRWSGHVMLMRKVRNAFEILVRKPEGNVPFVITRRKWKDNIKM